MARHIHLHLYDAFEESKHPRGKGGQFAATSGGVSEPAPRLRAHAGPWMSDLVAAQRLAAAKKSERQTLLAGAFRTDAHVEALRKAFAPNGAQRSKIVRGLQAAIRAPDRLVGFVLKHEVKEWREAGGAIRDILAGRAPEMGATKALEAVSLKIMTVIASSAMKGDLGNSMIVGAIALDMVHHTIAEQTAKFAVAGARFIRARRAAHDAADASLKTLLEWLMEGARTADLDPLWREAQAAVGR